MQRMLLLGLIQLLRKVHFKIIQKQCSFLVMQIRMIDPFMLFIIHIMSSVIGRIYFKSCYLFLNVIINIEVDFIQDFHNFKFSCILL